jgi:hypothetical protein
MRYRYVLAVEIVSLCFGDDRLRLRMLMLLLMNSLRDDNCFIPRVLEVNRSVRVKNSTCLAREEKPVLSLSPLVRTQYMSHCSAIASLV